jgi:hypothetical protein
LQVGRPALRQAPVSAQAAAVRRTLVAAVLRAEVVSAQLLRK